MNTPSTLRPDVDATVLLLLPDGRREYLGLHEWPSRETLRYLSACQHAGKRVRIAVRYGGARAEVDVEAVTITGKVVEGYLGVYVKPTVEVRLLPPVPVPPVPAGGPLPRTRA